MCPHNWNGEGACAMCKVIFLQRAIGRVRDLHQDERGYCSYCWGYSYAYAGSPRIPYPCPTIEALEGVIHD